MRYEWQGHYLDGLTAIRQPATVRLMREGLEVETSGGWRRLWPYGEVRQSQGFYAGEEVRLERGGEIPEVLLIPDVAFLTSLHAVAPAVRGRFHDPSRRGQRVRLTALAAVALVGITGALYLWGIPVMAALVAPRVPVAWEQRLGRSTMEYLAPRRLICSDERRQRMLDAIVARLAEPTRSPYRFRLVVVNQPIINALAAPGGDIIVYRGLLEQMRTPEELAGILAHEMQHVQQRHITQAVIQHASTGLLLAAVTGDMTGPLAYGLQSARVLGQLQYSRRAEAQADAGAMKMLLAARVDPSGMLQFFETLTSEETHAPGALRYLSSHPSPSARLERLRTLAAGAPGPPVPLLPGVDWEDVKRICATAGTERPGP